MIIDLNSEKPIFQQIAEGLEDAILTGAFPEETQIPSITELSVTLRINPATALKGVDILVDSDIVYKKRGVGMFVRAGALEKLRQMRKERFFDSYVTGLVKEARRLGLSEGEIIKLVERGFAQ